MMKTITEYRGVKGLVAAEIITDSTEEFETGEVFYIAGVSEISRASNSSSEAHYYDNKPAIVITSTSADTVTISASAIPLDVLAKITGQTYDEDTGALIEGNPEVKYFALGYQTKNTAGEVIYVWRLRGRFGIPDQTSVTEDSGTAANGQQLVYTGVETNHIFSSTGKSAKALVVNTSLGLADVTDFFSEVTTPDTLVARTAYTLTKTQGAETILTIERNGKPLATGATIYAGDYLTITCSYNGSVTVNGDAFFSGDIHKVRGDTTVVSTKNNA